jgi:hypothetical protein
MEVEANAVWISKNQAVRRHVVRLQETLIIVTERSRDPVLIWDNDYRKRQIAIVQHAIDEYSKED